MNRFYARRHNSPNDHGNDSSFIFVSKRLARLIYQKRDVWFYRYYVLEPFDVFEDYVAILIGSNGTVLFVKY